MKNELSVKAADTESMKRAAYALNMCTVSVAQIVDYNDEYVLEQEYDAILNNLNLEQMPKDEALLTILTELMNTITFFRIQEIKKAQIEKKYQRRLSNAIWSAVPNIGLIVAGGDPITTAISLASQVGIGYMNYRKEKANAAYDRDNENTELEITAIEQFNAIKRELFTTAWRLADTYKFPDQYRLTEKQIKQYNLILMDSDEIRKYERLETIQDNFQAYPPFWYFFGHTANYIAGCKEFDLDEQTRQKYRTLAKSHFETYVELNKLSILREDQIAASCHLEYAEMLLLEGKEQYSKIAELLQEAIKKSGYDNDILQIAALNYVRIGKLEEAGRIFKILVNEDYNKLTNARLLSRIYVSCFLHTHNETFRINYKVLQTRVDHSQLFPMPTEGQNDKQLQEEYIAEQRAILRQEYHYALTEYLKKYSNKVNHALDAFFNDDVEITNSQNNLDAKREREKNVKYFLEGHNKDENLQILSHKNFRRQYMDILNDMLSNLNFLSFFNSDPVEKREIIRTLKLALYQRRDKLAKYQNDMDEGTFTFESYRQWREDLDFERIAAPFLRALKNASVEKIDGVVSSDVLDQMEYEIAEFCLKQKIDLSFATLDNAIKVQDSEDDFSGLDYMILGSDVENAEDKLRFENLVKLASQKAGEIILNPAMVAVYVYGNADFDTYFRNSALRRKGIKGEVIAVIDDKTKKDCDLLLTQRGFSIVKNNTVQPLRAYRRMKYVKVNNKERLDLGWPDTFSNAGVNATALFQLVEEIEDEMK